VLIVRHVQARRAPPWPCRTAASPRRTASRR
jgi:hypothetical protein